MKYLLAGFTILIIVFISIKIDRSLREKPQYYLQFHGAYTIYYIESTDTDDYVLHSNDEDTIYVGTLAKCIYYMSVLSAEPVETKEPTDVDTYLPL